MYLTISTVAIVLIWHVKRIGPSKAILHPYSWVCLLYLFFFMSPPSEQFHDISMTVDFAVWLSFVLFSSVFMLFHKLALRGSPRFMAFIWNRNIGNIRPLHPFVIVCLAVIPVVSCLIYLYIRSEQLGSLEDALFGFYKAKRITTEMLIPFDRKLFAFLARFTRVLFPLSMGALFLMRIDALMNRRRIALIIFWCICFLLLLTLSTTGARGHAVRLATVILIADACVSVRIGKTMIFRPGYIVLLCSALFIVITLTMVREHTFDSFSNMLAYIEKISFEAVVVEGSSTVSKGGSIPDEVAFCFQYYGTERDFRYCHTPWAIMVNLIPRELWPEKPMGFGKMLAIDKGAPVTTRASYAAGLAGEGYANGGWIGVVLLSVMVGIICGTASGLSYGMFLGGGIMHLFMAIAIQKVTSFFVRGDMLLAWSSLYPIFVILLVLVMLNILFNSQQAATLSHAPPRNYRGFFRQFRTSI